MADVAETVRFVDEERDKLPEELAGFVGLGFDDNNRLVGLEESGGTKQIRNVGQALLHFAVQAGVAEEAPPAEDIPAEMRAAFEALIIERLEPLNDRIQRLEKDKAGLEETVHRLEREKKELEDRITELTKEPPEEEEVAGFKKDDAVGIRNGDKYIVGFSVAGFTEPDAAGKRDIRIRDADGKEHSVDPSVLKKRGEIRDGEIQNVPPLVRQKVDYREPVSVRLRRRLSGEPEPAEYYQDEEGRHYYLVDDEPVYVDERRDAAGAVVLAVGAAALGGLIGYTLANKSGGHNYSSDFSEIINQNSGLKQQVHDLSLQNAHELRALHGLHSEIARDHTQEMKKIGELQKEINGGSGGFKEHIQNSGAYWGMRYPWDWAANKVGAYRAEGWLHTLASKAAAHGHHIRWFTNSAGKEILQVDGRTDTSYVVKAISGS